MSNFPALIFSLCQSQWLIRVNHQAQIRKEETSVTFSLIQAFTFLFLMFCHNRYQDQTVHNYFQCQPCVFQAAKICLIWRRGIAKLYSDGDKNRSIWPNQENEFGHLETTRSTDYYRLTINNITHAYN